jgi:HSP90 family molecular chaperone
VRVDAWTPVAAEVHVSDVARLVDQLGGAWLYGDAPEVALRELLQNAMDAVRARRELEDRSCAWGSITVALDTAQDETFRLSVSDVGVGMSETVLPHCCPTGRRADEVRLS